MRLVSLVGALVVVHAGLAVAAPSGGIALESYSRARPDDAARAVAPVLSALAQRGFAAGVELGKRFEGRVSRAAGTAGDLPVGFLEQVDRGTKAWIGGKFEDAVAVLAPLVDAAHDVTGAFLGDTRLRDGLLRALIVLGLSQQRLGDPAAAHHTFEEVVRSFPDATVARSTYGPEAAASFDQQKKELAAAAKGRLLIKVENEQTEVYINERLERRGTTVKEVLPGDYRIVVQLAGQRSRNHRVTVKAGEEITVAIDPAFDAVVQTGGWAGFTFASAADRETSEAAFAAAYAHEIDGTAVVVIGLDTVRGSRAVVGSLVLMNGKEIRRASLALDPAPTADRIEALAKFLAGEKVTAGIDVQLDGAMPVAPLAGTGRGPAPIPRDPGGRWGGWPWLTGGVAVIALGIGAVELALDGTCKDGTSDPNCPELYDNKLPGWAAIGGGAVFAGITIYLIVSRPTQRSRQAFVAPAVGGGAVAGISGRW